MKSFRLRVSVLMTTILLAAVLNAQGFFGQVTRVIDGDTIMMDVDGSPIKVRLSHIDAPETDQPYGESVKLFLEKVLLGRNIELVSEGTDQYGRTLGVVYVNGKNLNLVLVQIGGAWQYKFDKNQEYTDAQRMAQSQRAGLWGEGTPIDPYLWRKGERPANSGSVTSQAAPMNPGDYYFYDAQADYNGTISKKRTQAREAFLRDYQKYRGYGRHNEAAKIIDKYIKDCDKGLYLTEEPDPLNYKMASRFKEHYLNFHARTGCSDAQRQLIRSRADLAWTMSLPEKKRIRDARDEMRRIKKTADLLDIDLE